MRDRVGKPNNPEPESRDRDASEPDVGTKGGGEAVSYALARDDAAADVARAGRFGIAILLLGCLDAFVLRLLPNRIPKPWAVRLGMFLLPLAWVVTAALARGADNSTQNWKALSSLFRPIVWMSALAIGLGLVTLDVAIQQVLFPDTRWEDVNLLSGRILQFTGLQAWMVMTAAGICFFPLLVLETGRSFPEVRRLSLSATEINGRQTISWFMTWMICVTGIIQQFVPAYGLTMAIWVVFAGVLNYVAYRDILERRSANVPQVIEAPVPAQARVLS